MSIGLRIEQATLLAPRQLLRTELLQGLETEDFPRVRVEGNVQVGSQAELYHTYARTLETIGFVAYQLAQPSVRKDFPKFYTDLNMRPMRYLLEGLSSLANISSMQLDPESGAGTLESLVHALIEETEARLILKDSAILFTDQNIKYEDSTDEESGQTTRRLVGFSDEDTLASLNMHINTSDTRSELAFLHSLTAKLYNQADLEGKKAILTHLQALVRASVESRVSAVQRHYSTSEYALPVSWKDFRDYTRRHKSQTVPYTAESPEISRVLLATGHVAHELKNPFAAVLANMQMLQRLLRREERLPAREEAASELIFRKWKDVYLVTRFAVHDLKEGNIPEVFSANELLHVFGSEMQALIDEPRESVKPISLHVINFEDADQGLSRLLYSRSDLRNLVRGIISDTSKVAATKADILGFSIYIVPRIENGKLHIRIMDSLGGFPPQLGIAMNEALPIPNLEAQAYAELGTGFGRGKNGYGMNTESDAPTALPSTGEGMALIRTSTSTKFKGDLLAWNVDNNGENLPANVRIGDNGKTYYVPRSEAPVGACYELVLPLQA